MCLSGPRPLMAKTDVVAAIATAGGRAAIGIIRLSGPELRGFMQALLGRVIPPRRAVLTDFLDSSGKAVDTGIALFFPAPHSYTGEDVLELQGHGGPAVLQLLLRRCLVLGARLAQPGEFSRRAFLNEKMDLAQAESVADLIEAGSEAAARAAMRSLKGEFSKEIKTLVSDLVALRALVEASIDFPEEDVDVLGEGVRRRRFRVLRDQLTRIQSIAVSGNLLRDGVQVVLVGQPNVGKSSLLNQLAGDEVAIVTDIPGTTRDPVRSEFLLGGTPIHIVDTAGLREARDPVEEIGIDRTWKAVQGADVVLLVIDVQQGRTAETDQIEAQLPDTAKRIIVVNKIDLVGRQPSRRQEGDKAEVEVSAKTGAGIGLLRETILEVMGQVPDGEGVFLARERHLEALRGAARHLKAGEEHFTQLEVFAEELRLAQVALSQITGEFTAEDLLSEIFSKFCIGK
jgi:tRNA modification GTPase